MHCIQETAILSRFCIHQNRADLKHGMSVYHDFVKLQTNFKELQEF